MKIEIILGILLWILIGFAFDRRSIDRLAQEGRSHPIDYLTSVAAIIIYLLVYPFLIFLGVTSKIIIFPGGKVRHRVFWVCLWFPISASVLTCVIGGTGYLAGLLGSAADPRIRGILAAALLAIAGLITVSWNNLAKRGFY